ncbi:protein-tyrosine-phosphatase MKP1-like [Cynara cardunculus var. scolymus]|uniref:Dual specificity phosphatase n=1 Tax=Cynara cardunculus var. scolymus TaxID=59895 RepID=A0A103YIH0_CYNCS|nr:protein-tyrosine-phosphatase MKP1-like [Cynara cardunculus var. scolymus]KVI09724.1 Dual specificity phosphatase [Cynara cardunculus var. scolymus]
MLGKEDGSDGGNDGDGGGGAGAPPPISGNRKMYWRSASWSSSRMSLPPLIPESEKDCIEPNGANGGNSRRFPAPLTPRSNSKGRSLLPPISIARRSLDEWPKAGSDDIGEWPLPSTPRGRDSSNGGERLKLDLSTIQRIPDKNAGLGKREKIAFFDKKCSKVADHVFLGGDAVARDKDILKQHGITHILNCVGFVCPEYFKANFVYRTLWLQDSPSEDITSILYDVFDYFEDVREQNGAVFVHCCQGVSRSTSLVIAYRMWREGQSFDDAFQYVKAARGIADPNMGFACQLLQCQKRVHAFPLSPSSLLRLYRIAPHSPYDPLHLVPKMLNSPSPAALDSRGAFIIHVPSTIYVWIGQKCESIMERDARGAVCQIIRYEKVQGPIVVVKEGEEPSYFWDAFSTFLPLMDVIESSKVTPGKRIVDSYNVDFEIFQKAIVGGFVPPFASSETEQETHLPARESTWSVLRRKFAFGNMKEFVFASKSSISRVYPDSGSILGTENNSVSKPFLISSNSLLSPSFSSSSSSSSHLSPDSISSSDSSVNSKCCSDSPAISPRVASCNHALSLSNLSLVPTKLSPHSISKTSEFIDVNFTSNPLSPSKRSSLSIAERRGGPPKCLKLPMVSDGSKACEQENVKLNYSGFTQQGPNQELLSQGSSCSKGSVSEGAFNQTSGGSNNIDLMEENELGSENVKQPVVAREWPSLKKVVRFDYGDLDSRQMFIFTAPSSGYGKLEKSVLYLWVGKDFRHHSRNAPGTSEGRAEPPYFDMKEVISDVRTQMSLSDDIYIKVVKQDEESSEFLALLSSL